MSRTQNPLPDFYCQEDVEPCVGFERDKLVRGFDLYQAKKLQTKYKKDRFVSVRVKGVSEREIPTLSVAKNDFQRPCETLLA